MLGAIAAIRRSAWQTHRTFARYHQLGRSKECQPLLPKLKLGPAESIGIGGNMFRGRTSAVYGAGSGATRSAGARLGRFGGGAREVGRQLAATARDGSVSVTPADGFGLAVASSQLVVSKRLRVRPRHRHNQRFSKFKLLAVRGPARRPCKSIRWHALFAIFLGMSLCLFLQARAPWILPKGFEHRAVLRGSRVAVHLGRMAEHPSSGSSRQDGRAPFREAIWAARRTACLRGRRTAPCSLPGSVESPRALPAGRTRG